MNRIRPIIAALTLSLCGPIALAQSTPPKEVTFNFKYKVGSTTRQRVVSRNVGSVAMPAPLPEQRWSQSVEETITMNCIGVREDGAGEFKMTIGDIKFKMTIGALTVNYDAATYDANAKVDWVTELISKVFHALNGTELKCNISATGQMLRIDGLGEAFKKMAASVANGKDQASVKTMFDQLGAVMDDETMSQELQSYYRLLPAKPGPYKIGDKWDHKWQMNLPKFGTAMSGHGNYELAAIEMYRNRPCVKILTKESFELTTHPTTQPASQKSPTTGKSNDAIVKLLEKFDMEMTTSGGDGYAYVDYTTGELVGLRTTQNIGMVMRVKPDAVKPENKNQPPVEIRQSYKTYASLDLLEPGQATVPAGEVATRPASPAAAR